MLAMFKYTDYLLRQLSRDVIEDEEVAQSHSNGVMMQIGRLHRVMLSPKAAHFFSDEHLHALLRLTWDPKS